MNYWALHERADFRAAAGAEFRPGGLRLTEELASLCVLRPGQRVLDVGCGVGSTVSYLAHTRRVSAVGLDCCPAFLDEARLRNPSSTWTLGRAEELPFEDGSFDAVFCECVLSLVDEPVRALREIRRVARPGGCLAMSDVYLRRPERASDLSGTPAGSCLRRAADRHRVLSQVRQAGFVVTEWADRSEQLKVLAARMVLRHRSIDSFWESVLGGARSRRDELAAARPGYYMLLARTTAEGQTGL